MKMLLKVTGILFGILASAGIIVLLLFYHFFYNTNHLPEGELIGEAISPTQDYTVKIYLVNGGATVSYAVRGEVIQHKKRDKKKNIYWQYKEEHSTIRWMDAYTVDINGVELDVRKDVYDWRKSD